MLTTALIIIIAAVIYVVSYIFYGKHILERKVVKADESRPTPAVKYNDGVDYVPTNKYVLMGHHFASIAGAGPIVGPALAMGWGWLMPLLWIWFGNIFVGAVHDYLALMASVRYDGRSIQWIAGRIISRRMGYAFSLFVYFALLLVIAAFGAVLGGLFSVHPTVASASIIQIILALVLGYLMYRMGIDVKVSAVIAVIFIVISIFLGVNLPIKMDFHSWLVFLLIYTFIAASLPVWVLLQPRDYMNSFLLYFGLLLGGIALIAANATLKLASITTFSAPIVAGKPSPFWPMVPLVIACGALSGFHSLVASGTSSKQLDKEVHGLLVGYGSMFAEGFLATLVVASIAAFLPLLLLHPADYGKTAVAVVDKLAKLNINVEQLLKDPQYFADNYLKVIKATGKVGVFTMSYAAAAKTALGLDFMSVLTFAGLWVAAFALTTLDTTVRLARFTWSEVLEPLGGASIRKILDNRWVASFIAAALGIAMAWNGAFKIIWPAFSGVNQMLASIAMMTSAAWVIRVLKAPKTYQATVLLPAMFLWITVTLALIMFVYYTLSGPMSVTTMAVSGITIVELIFNFVLLYEFVRKVRE